MEAGSSYPVQFDVEYPERELNRLTTAFRIFMAIPIAIVLAALGGETQSYAGSHWQGGVSVGGLLLFAPLLMILFRQKYPRWWFDWNLELLRFQNRVGVYLALLDDRYPSTDEHQSCGCRCPTPTPSGTSTAGCRSSSGCSLSRTSSCWCSFGSPRSSS